MAIRRKERKARRRRQRGVRKHRPELTQPAMGEDRGPSAQTGPTQERRPAASEQSGVFGKHPLGPAQRRTLAGFARAFSLSNHLLEASARVGRSRTMAENLAHLPGQTRCQRQAQMGRSLRRWQLCPGEKRGLLVGKTKRGKGTKWMVVVDGQGPPLGAHLDSPSPHEVTLIEKTLDKVAVPRKGRGRPKKNPRRLVYDMAADSDPLRDWLGERGIELICPHRYNRTKSKRQDGRKLRRYRRRWRVERKFAWLGNLRRLVVRYERNIQMYAAFFHLACLIITLRRF
jgi:transposase